MIAIVRATRMAILKLRSTRALWVSILVSPAVDRDDDGAELIEKCGRPARSGCATDGRAMGCVHARPRPVSVVPHRAATVRHARASTAGRSRTPREHVE